VPAPVLVRIAGPFAERRALLLRAMQRKHRILVAAVAHASFSEGAVAGYPVEGPGVVFPGVGLEHQPLVPTGGAFALGSLVWRHTLPS
jgi:hypothetical protein